MAAKSIFLKCKLARSNIFKRHITLDDTNSKIKIERKMNIFEKGKNNTRLQEIFFFLRIRSNL